MTIEAALLGQGIALVRSGHVEAQINDGRLVRLFEVPFASPVAYDLLAPKASSPSLTSSTFVTGCWKSRREPNTAIAEA